MNDSKNAGAKNADGQSTVPENWPGIPGRSKDDEKNPNGEKKAADVTEQQRELERKPPAGGK